MECVNVHTFPLFAVYYPIRPYGGNFLHIGTHIYIYRRATGKGRFFFSYQIYVAKYPHISIGGEL